MYEVEFVRKLASGRCVINSEFFPTFKEAIVYVDKLLDNVHVIHYSIFKDGELVP